MGGGFSDSSRQAFAENFAKLPAANGYSLDLLHFLHHRQRVYRRPVKRKFEDTEENETENETNNSNHAVNETSTAANNTMLSKTSSVDTELISRLISPVIVNN